MVSKKTIEKYKLKCGEDYIRICGLNMKRGDSFKVRGRKIVVADIIDESSFLDDDYEYWDVSMFDSNDVVCGCQMGGGLSEYRKYTVGFKK